MNHTELFLGENPDPENYYIHMNPRVHVEFI